MRGRDRSAPGVAPAGPIWREGEPWLQGWHALILPGEPGHGGEEYVSSVPAVVAACRDMRIRCTRSDPSRATARRFQSASTRVYPIVVAPEKVLASGLAETLMMIMDAAAEGDDVVTAQFGRLTTDGRVQWCIATGSWAAVTDHVSHVVGSFG